MTHLRSIFAITVLLSLLAARPVQAWVILGVLGKGEIPEHRCSKELAAALKKVPPIRGETIDGLGHYTCRLFYRGAQSNLQELLDSLGQLDDVILHVRIDRSSKVGILESRKAFPVERRMPYVYGVAVSWHDRLERPGERGASSMFINVNVFAAAGIDPDKLLIPEKARHPNQLAAKQTGADQ